MALWAIHDVETKHRRRKPTMGARCVARRNGGGVRRGSRPLHRGRPFVSSL